MSRLTAPLPSHLRTSTFPIHHQPPHPLSPPETDMESYHPARPASLPAHDPRHQHQHPFHTLVPETPNRPSSPYSIVTDFAGKNVRRPSSTLPYTQSGIKDRRRSVAKGPKWLVMVFPPTLLHQQESSASSSKHVQNGPSGRFLSGVLMPLYSTVCLGSLFPVWPFLN